MFRHVFWTHFYSRRSVAVGAVVRNMRPDSLVTDVYIDVCADMRADLSRRAYGRVYTRARTCAGMRVDMCGHV